MGSRWKATTAWVLMISALATSAMANGVLRDGVGAVSMGRGGTNLAFADNTAILLDNPAGMVNIVDRSMCQVSVDGLATDLTYQDPFTADQAAFRPVALPHIGYIQRTEDSVWAWGLAVVAPAGFGTQFEQNDPVYGQQNYSSFGALAKVLPGVACQVTEKLSVGATLGLGISYASLDGPFYLQTGALQGAPTIVDLQGAGAALVYSLGLQYYLTDRTMLGISYQSESRFKLDGNSHVDVLAPVVLSSGFDSQISITWPRTVGVGLVHQLGENSRVSADVIYVNWTDAFDSMGIRLTNADNPVVTALLGPTITDQLPFHWTDSVSVRTGYEYLVDPNTVLRAGYIYNSNQVPSGTLTTYLPAILEHGVTVGWGHSWDCWSMDMAYQFLFGRDRTVGTSDLAGGDFNNSVFGAQAHWLSAALTRRF